MAGWIGIQQSPDFNKVVIKLFDSQGSCRGELLCWWGRPHKKKTKNLIKTSGICIFFDLSIISNGVNECGAMLTFLVKSKTLDQSQELPKTEPISRQLWKPIKYFKQSRDTVSKEDEYCVISFLMLVSKKLCMEMSSLRTQNLCKSNKITLCFLLSCLGIAMWNLKIKQIMYNNLYLQGLSP